MKIKVELFKGRDGYRVRLRGRNGEPFMVGESYASKSNATRAARKLAKALGVKVMVVRGFDGG